MDYAIIALLITTVLGVTVAAPERMVGKGFDIKARLTEYLNKEPFSQCRHPVHGTKARSDMLNFISTELEVIKVRSKEFNATIEQITFNTTVIYLGNHYNVNATNMILTFPGTVNITEDEPLMILSNYDTDENANFINEGSGVAAQLVIAEHLVEQMLSKNHTLKHSVIFAFTDVAFKKYAFHQAAEGTTGATEIAKSWLPQFMNQRKSFRGAIVLDNIMNYNESAKSQLVAGVGFDKSFSESYKKMSDSGFAANFLALVHRDDHLDSPLAKRIQDAWTHSKKEVKAFNDTDGHHGSQIDPILLAFPFEANPFVTDAVTHFMQSEQTAFWNHHVERAGKLYPAVTLTDTRFLRGDACRRSCDVREMTTKPKLAFIKRTIDTVCSVILDAQTDANGAASLQVQTSTIVFFSSIVIAFITNKLL